MSSAHSPLLPHHFLSASSAGAGGDEDPNNNNNNPFRLKSSHEVDESGDKLNLNLNREAKGKSAQPKRIRRSYQPDPGSSFCPICQRVFKSSKALHGHMRSHPDRAWRGMTAPHLGPPVMQAKGGYFYGADTEATYQFRCSECGTIFRTKQALGGHRASHKSKKGCYMKWREGLGSSSSNANRGGNLVVGEQVRFGGNVQNERVEEERGNNGGEDGNNRGDGLELGLGLGLGLGLSGVDLNFPPPEEEEEEEDEEEDEEDQRGK